MMITTMMITTMMITTTMIIINYSGLFPTLCHLEFNDELALRVKKYSIFDH